MSFVRKLVVASEYFILSLLINVIVCFLLLCYCFFILCYLLFSFCYYDLFLLLINYMFFKNTFYPLYILNLISFFMFPYFIYAF